MSGGQKQRGKRFLPFQQCIREPVNTLVQPTCRIVFAAGAESKCSIVYATWLL